jgi:hypothetical protein
MCGLRASIAACHSNPKQHPQLLAAQRLYMHWAIKPHPYHLRDAAGIVTISFVDLRLSKLPDLS